MRALAAVVVAGHVLYILAVCLSWLLPWSLQLSLLGVTAATYLITGECLLWTLEARLLWRVGLCSPPSMTRRILRVLGWRVSERAAGAVAVGVAVLVVLIGAARHILMGVFR